MCIVGLNLSRAQKQCRLGETPRDLTVALRGQLDQLRAPLLGVVANRVKRRSHRKGYGYYASSKMQGSPNGADEFVSAGGAIRETAER